jgi:hypothetical protein
MPRDGSGIYTRPPGTNAVPDTTIESTKYNGFVGDVETDLNAPRPIIAGGTGSSTAAGALTALGAVAKAGDTMSGDLTITKANPALFFNKSVSGQSNYISGQTAGVARWWIRPGNDAAESGSNAGSNFDMLRYSDTGVYLGVALDINRATGATTITSPVASTSAATGALTVAGGVGIGGLLYTGGEISMSVYTNADARFHINNMAAGGGQWWLGASSPFSGIVGLTGFAIYDKLAAALRLAILEGGSVYIPTNIASTSSTTGALRVVGGVGIGGSLYVSGDGQIGTSAQGRTMRVWGDGGHNTGLKLKYTGGSGNPISLIQGSDDQFYIGFGTTSIAYIDRISGVYSALSDERLKPNREMLSHSVAREVVDALEIYDYDKAGNALRGVGLTAQQAHSVHKTLGQPGTNEGDYWFADKAAPVPFIISNVQQINQRLDRLERLLKEES